MTLLMTPKNRSRSVLFGLLGPGIIGSWVVRRRWLEKQRKRSQPQRNHTLEGIAFPEWFSQENDVEGMAETQESTKAQTCVLYHTYVSINSRETCTPNHWHATYWLRFMALVEQEPLHAIVQHTDTKRYHVMVQLPGEVPLSCDDCCSAHEVFRVPVQEYYAYFVFAPYHPLDGFTTFQQAQEGAQSRPLPGDLHQLLPRTKTKRLLSEG